MKKTCTKCFIEKELEEFGINKSFIGVKRYFSQCYECRRAAWIARDRKKKNI